MASLREGGAEAWGEGWDVATRFTSIHSMGSGGSLPATVGSHLELPGKAYARELQKIICPIVELQIKEENYEFLPGHEKLDQLCTLHRAL